MSSDSELIMYMHVSVYFVCLCVCICLPGYCYLDFIDGNIELRDLVTCLRSFQGGKAWIWTVVCLSLKPNLLNTTLQFYTLISGALVFLACFQKPFLFLSIPEITFNNLTTVTFLNKYRVLQNQMAQDYILFFWLKINCLLYIW